MGDGIVSDLVRRYTSQWGLPDLITEGRDWRCSYGSTAKWNGDRHVCENPYPDTKNISFETNLACCVNCKMKPNTDSTEE